MLFTVSQVKISALKKTLFGVIQTMTLYVTDILQTNIYSLLEFFTYQYTKSDVCVPGVILAEHLDIES